MLQVETRVKRSTLGWWVCGSVWRASLIPFFIALLITTALFLLFFFLDDSFTALFPVSEVLWVPLAVLLAVMLGQASSLRIAHDRQRVSLFMEFCGVCLGRPDGKELASAYITAHRGHNQEPTLPPDAWELWRIWLRSVAWEAQRRDWRLTTFLYMATWLYVITVPFLLWSAYEWYGFAGCVLVQWSLLALTYGNLHVGRPFEKDSWFSTFDFDDALRQFGRAYDSSKQK
jgi:hypothetical protein